MVTELHLKRAEQKPTSVAVVWVATLQGVHAVWPELQLQGVRPGGGVEDTAAHKLRDEQAAVACLVMGLVWSPAVWCLAAGWG